jgi:hypothetical protein
MKFRNIVSMGLIFTIASAFAQDCSVQGAEGAGMLQTRDGRTGEFRMSVAKRTCGDESRLGGAFSFSTFNREARTGISIELRHLRELSVEGNAAGFAGSAVMLVRTTQGAERVEGALSVRATDRRRAGQEGEPDLLSLRFVTATTNRVFEFAGAVARGDLVVFTRRLHACRIQGAEGAGVAQSRDNRASEFRFGVRKRTCPDSSSLLGSFRFSTMNPNSREGITIEMGRVREFVKEGNVARFSGPAVMVIRTPNGIRRVEGAVAVNVADRRRGETGDPDTIAVRFTSPTTNAVFEFAGAVTRGDIVVFERME